MRTVFDRIVYQKTLLEIVQAGYLVDLRAFQVLLRPISIACVPWPKIAFR